MKLIIGLGNPGKKYEKTRHNFGFMAAEHVPKNMGAFEGWTQDSQSNALTAKGEIAGQKILLVKPQTFMNLSGSAVKNLMTFYKIAPQNIFVVHDDFDLPLGVIRVSKNVSNGGHKGVRSIIEALGTKDFVRVRLGIRPQGQTFFSALFKRNDSAEKFVLKNFSRDETRIAQETIAKASQAIETALKEGVEYAMNKYN